MGWGSTVLGAGGATGMSIRGPCPQGAIQSARMAAGEQNKEAYAEISLGGKDGKTGKRG